MPVLFAAVLALFGATSCWSPPVDAPVTDGFRAPACTWCPGNRGIEYGPRPGQPVTAVAAGMVSFAGPVAGTLYVVVDHLDGIRATYGRLAEVSVSRGQIITSGTHIGSTTAGFYFGLRKGVTPNEAAIDPTPMLGFRRYPARLVPADGTPAPPAGPGRLVCRNASTGR